MHQENLCCLDLPEPTFWAKLVRFAKRTGRDFVTKALILFHAWQSPDTPLWAKGVIATALGYFLCPVDVVPDPTPILGFSDDAAVIASALVAVAAHITPQHRAKAEASIRAWFG